MTPEQSRTLDTLIRTLSVGILRRASRSGPPKQRREIVRMLAMVSARTKRGAPSHPDELAR